MDGTRPPPIALLAEALVANTSLRALDLQRNSVRCQGAIALAAALQLTSGLHELSLRFNEIGDAGASALGKALRANCALRTLGSLVMSAGSTFSTECWRHCFMQSLIPLLKDVQLSLQQATQSKGQKVEGAELGVKSSGEKVRMIMHHSRDTAEKQWLVAAAARVTHCLL